MYTVLLAIPPIGYWLFRLNKIFAFWCAYIMTRSVGAPFSEWISVPQSTGGLGLGKGLVSLVMTIIIIGFVWYLAVSHVDVMGERDEVQKE